MLDRQAYEALLAQLLAEQAPDGGWGARAGARADTESTALATAALLPGHARQAAAGAAWLRQRQQPNGAWRFTEDGPDVVWTTPIAALTLLAAGGRDGHVTAALNYLQATRHAGPGWRHRLAIFLGHEGAVKVDQTIPGWPWVPGTFAWVEPSSWAMILFRAAWRGRTPAAVQRRIRQGELMLADRASVGGGWNYGNRQVFDELLPPYPDTTAVALMALRGTPGPVVDDGFTRLVEMVDEHASRLTLALSVLAHRVWGRPYSAHADRLAADVLAEPLHDTRSIAFAALALAPDTRWITGAP
jgi:hypothetical protein